MNIKFEFEKETKGAVRFKEQADRPVVGTLYIKKEALPELGVSTKDNIIVSISKEDKRDGENNSLRAHRHTSVTS